MKNSGTQVTCRCGVKVLSYRPGEFVYCDHCDQKARAFVLRLSDEFPAESWEWVFLRKLALSGSQLRAFEEAT